MNTALRVSLFALPLLALACSDDSSLADDSSENPSTGEDSGDGDGDGPGDGDGDGESHDSCSYTSPFTSGPECRDYIGEAWTNAETAADCAQVSGDLAPGQPCADEDTLGRCVLDALTDWEQQIVVYGTDPSSCSLQATGCETFGGGNWEPEPICEGQGGGGGGGGKVFIQPTRVCVDPLPGEPAGQSEGGQVCTWQAISASTEEGRRFEDYASCEVIYTQRPYYGAPSNPAPAEPDPRLDDPSYVAELTWVREQIEASACVCCHSEDAPSGPSNWYVEAPNNWMSSFYDSGLALGAGWVNSVAFGAYDPADNNGFDRIHSGFPTTDPERMVAFFAAELAYRGKGEADFADAEPFGGPLYDQLVYEPEACESGEGVEPDGRVVWTGGLARYVYVLEAESQSPTVPPNLDLPMGTLWRIDVPWDGGEPIGSGEVVYGQLPVGMSQRYPIDGAPQELVPGQAYYLYVSKDVGIPITRCLFTY
ncbi:MAG TPA: hypothetical protein VM869_00135 [Enhygromyxa sp.]|nr:hypothetical protein [Enhygromyxa sp.]